MNGDNAPKLRNRLAAACEDHAAGRLTDEQFIEYTTRTCRGFDGTVGDDGSDVGLIEVVLLDVLREPFEGWLWSRELRLVPIPQTDPYAIPTFTTTPSDAALATADLSRFDEGGDPA